MSGTQRRLQRIFGSMGFRSRKRQVFYDGLAIEFYDDKNPGNEDRFLLLGLSAALRLLLVCHCYRAENAVIRIISARKATKNEAEHYQR